jgi:type III restriction enzyme
VFELARALTRDIVAQGRTNLPAHVLFPQLVRIAGRFVDERVIPTPPAQKIDVFLSPYYGLAIEILTQAIQPDAAAGDDPEVPRYEANRGPGTTADVSFWTSRDVREAVKSHVNYVVADTAKWEQSAAYQIDRHAAVEAFVKNAGLGFAIPYLHNGAPHDFVPDFIIRLAGAPARHLILETKGYDELKDVKAAAAERWVAAVNADGQFGEWAFRMVTNISEVTKTIDQVCGS